MAAYRREILNQQAKAYHHEDHRKANAAAPQICREQSSWSVQVVDLVREFSEIAEIIAQVIVDELHCPKEKKLIPATKLGGVAGGEKFVSHGILFKFAIDSRGFYNGDEFAMKATQVS